MIACIFALFVFAKNFSFWSQNKPIRLFTWLHKYQWEPSQETGLGHKAKYPPIDDEYLSNVPDGLVLAKYGNKYVRYPISKGHARSAIILGTPGSGKSTLLLTTLIYQLHHKLHKGEERQVFFILDCKPELLRKSSYPGKRIRELNIQDRSKCGWDPYFNLNSTSTDDEVLSELDVIARALIDCGKNDKNEFFYSSARSIFKFLCLAEYKKGCSFIQSVNHIMDASLMVKIQDVLESAEGKPELIKVIKGLNGYVGKKGEAMESIENTLRENMEIFQRDNTQYFLDGNPRKMSPKALEKKISVAFTIKTTQIKDYKTILRLVVMQLLHFLEDRDEDTSHLITLVIDEAYRLGLINWIDFLSVCRSKQVACILAFQSLSQMMSVWSKEDTDSLLEMVSVIAILSCASSTTAKMVCDWAGEYLAEKYSFSVGGKNDGQTTKSYEAKKVLEPKDLMDIKKKDEIILFLDGTYYRAKVDRAKYFNISKLLEISQKCVEAHKQINRRNEL